MNNRKKREQEWYQKNKDKIKLQQKIYLSIPENRERKTIKDYEWRKNHPEKVKVYSKKSYEKHKEERELRRRQKRRDDNLIKNGGLPKCLQGEDNFYKKWTEYYIVLSSYCVIIRNWYIKLYQDESISMNQIEKITGYTHLHRTFKTYKIQIPIFRKEKWHSYQHQNHCNLSKEAIEWINGELLGDGCVTIKRKSLASGSFNYLSQHLEYINYISDTLNNYGINQTSQIRKVKGWNNDNYYYQYKSRYYVELALFRKQWYPEGEKIVPKDIKLTPLTCRQWYIGDGCLAQGKDRSSRIHLSTQGFTKSDNEWLASELKDLGFKATVVAHKGSYIDKLGSKIIKTYYYLYVPCCSTKDFLDYIGKCPVDCYQYKWNYIKYEKEHIPRLFEDRGWMYQKYVIEEMSGTKISILCEATSRTVYNWLIKFNITRRSNSEANKGPKIERICKTCGKKFYVIPSKAKQKYCLQKCYTKARLGINNPNYRHGKYIRNEFNKKESLQLSLF